MQDDHPYAEMGPVALAKSELGLIQFAYGNGPPSNVEGEAWPPRVAATWYLAKAVLQLNEFVEDYHRRVLRTPL